MNEQQLGDDEVYFLDGVGAIDAGKVSFQEVRKIDLQEQFGTNRAARRRVQKLIKKRGRGYTR